MTDLSQADCHFRRLRPLALCLIVGIALLPAWARAQSPKTIRSGDYIVAIVNSELVTAVEVEQRLDRARATVSGASEDKLRTKVLDELIEERVIITYARDSGIKVEGPEIDRAVSGVAAQNKMTLQQLRDRLKAEGLEYPRFRDSLRDQLMVERVREREVQGRIRVGDDEIENLLDKQRGEAANDVEYDIAQILVSIPADASAEVLAQRRARADAALARVRGGEDFAKVATEISEDGNRSHGGQIGLRPAKRLPDAFVDVVRRLNVGQVAAAPLQTAAGFHVLKLIERRETAAFTIPQTHARHILLRVSARAPTELVVKRIDELRQQIETGKRDFEAIAREQSEDGSAPTGGDLGWVSPGAFVPEFEEVMNKLAIGALSQPLVSRFGVHLIQVLERREAALDPKEVREQARNLLREQKFEQAYAEWTRDLRARAYVEMREPPL
jgi:peptidyl-prolyl cis-trans isomerase SurA